MTTTPNKIGRANRDKRHRDLQKTTLKPLALIVLLAAPLLQGCITRMVLDSADRKHYLEYLNQAEQRNLEREKSGLQPQKIMTLQEWQRMK